jgi:Protein of unknown function (DUF2934)
MRRNQYHQIARRAHEYWVKRGCPLGTPEADWYMAEKELKETRLSKAAREVGSLTGKVMTTIKPYLGLLPRRRQRLSHSPLG